jgi:flavoprotein
MVPPNESLNPIAGKIVLERYDGFVVSSTNSGSLQVVLSILENANN